MTMTAEELEIKCHEVVAYLRNIGDNVYAEYVAQLIVRYKAANIKANNYQKALEALDHASKQ